MAYCPSCGTEFEKDARYCQQCGAGVDATQEVSDGSASSSIASGRNEIRTATVQTQQEKRHYNVDNLAYLRRLSGSLSSLGWLIVAFFGAAVLLVMFFAIQAGETILAAVIVLVAILLIASFVSGDSDTLEVGTLTGIDEYEGNESRNFVKQVTDMTDRSISVSGRYSSRLRVWEYRYHFFPDNIVSINQSDSYSWVLSLIVGLALMAGGVVLIEESSGLGVLMFVSGLILGIILLDREEIVELDLQGGDMKGFVMDPGQAQRMINEFSSPSKERSSRSSAGSSEDASSSGLLTQSATDSNNGKNVGTNPGEEKVREYSIKTKTRMGEEVTVCGGCGADVNGNAKRCSSCGCGLADRS